MKSEIYSIPYNTENCWLSLLYIIPCKLWFTLLFAAREAPYAKKRTNLSQNIQLSRHHNHHGQSRTAAENGPILLSWSNNLHLKPNVIEVCYCWGARTDFDPGHESPTIQVYGHACHLTLLALLCLCQYSFYWLGIKIARGSSRNT